MHIQRMLLAYDVDLHYRMFLAYDVDLHNRMFLAYDLNLHYILSCHVSPVICKIEIQNKGEK